MEEEIFNRGMWYVDSALGKLRTLSEDSKASEIEFDYFFKSLAVQLKICLFNVL
jgi:hypothetical protein